VKVRHASREDIDTFSSMANKPTILGWVGEIDGKIVAIGGLAFTKGRWFGFLDLKDEARPFKMTIARNAIRVLCEAERLGIKYIYAEADKRETGSERWLKRLGFELDPRTANLYRWGK
jgi:RimJ/RimL family protein N-acetyltransferase